MSTGKVFLKVAVFLPLRKLFTYTHPEPLPPGTGVIVPFRKSLTAGIVLGESESYPDAKPISEVIPPIPLLHKEMIETAHWLSEYYIAPYGEVFRSMIPTYLLPTGTERYIATGKQTSLTPKEQEIFQYIARSSRGLTRKYLVKRFGHIHRYIRSLEEKGMIRKIEKRGRIKGDIPYLTTLNEPLHPLTSSQKQAEQMIADALKSHSYKTFLLHGVTASGKTEIYISVINRAISMGYQALYLVPEIALTAQVLDRLKRKVKGKLAVYHSKLTDKERAEVWMGVRDGKIDVVVGARASILLPLQNPGVYIVDEEHDPSYKQGEGAFRYHARDVAVLLAYRNNAVCVLGSATPSLESYANAKTGKYTLIHLPERIKGKDLPTINIVDITYEDYPISNTLRQAIEKRLQRGEQTILFLNRRGYAHFLLCKKCRYIPHCPNCSITLRYHKATNTLSCHYCGYTKPAPSTCPGCKKSLLIPIGEGTERIEEILRETFPNANIARMDTDALTRKTAHIDLYRGLKEGNIDILVGTQMVTKGIDLPKVTLVGVIMADSLLNFPDFRSAERTFQLLTQVAGRAGRGDIEGEVIIQTYTPEHPAIFLAQEEKIEEYYERELELRKELFYPPFSRLYRFILSGKNKEKVKKSSDKLAKLLVKYTSGIVLGPAPAPLSKLKKQYRWHILLKAEKEQKPCSKLLWIMEHWKTTPGVELIVDVDPIDVM